MRRVYIVDGYQYPYATTKLRKSKHVLPSIVPPELPRNTFCTTTVDCKCLTDHQCLVCGLSSCGHCWDDFARVICSG